MNIARRTFLALAAATSASAISPAAFAQDKGLVGVALPANAQPRWLSDGVSLRRALEEKDYAVDLQYAEDDVAKQLEQVENMVTAGAKVLVIAAMDGKSLSGVLQLAADRDIKVVAYDRLILDSLNVDYYVTFDNFEVGVLQAQSILKGLDFPSAAGPFTIELFAGSLDDSNTSRFYDGAMSILQPLIDKGTLVIKSGQASLEAVATLRWDAAIAQARMSRILAANYSDGSRVDAVLAPNDRLARGIIASFRDAAYGTAEQPWPIVTGQDAEVPSIKAMIAGEQYSTIFKDTRELAKAAAEMVDAIVDGRKPGVNDEKTYNNGVKIVPSRILHPVVVLKGDIQKVLVESGYIKPEDAR